jgi:Tfp pilus assembly protein PilP
MRRAAPTAAVLLAAVALAACGDSAEENAQNTVCDARADISEKVDELKAMTPATFNVDDASEALSAIRADLTQIKDAQEELTDDRREQVSSANEAFESQVTQIADQVGGSGSAADAQSQLTAAFQQLAASYEQTFARVDCS